jgi:hypothetical protein
MVSQGWIDFQEEVTLSTIEKIERDIALMEMRRTALLYSIEWLKETGGSTETKATQLLLVERQLRSANRILSLAYRGGSLG